MNRPAQLVFGLVLLLATVSFVQGLRMAHDRHQRLLPRRVVGVLVAGDTGAVFPWRPDGFLLASGLPPATRVGLVERLAHRSLVRWMEPAADDGNLVIPLAGLSPGRYALTRHRAGDRPQPEEMDRPVEAPDLLGEFELRAETP